MRKPRNASRNGKSVLRRYGNAYRVRTQWDVIHRNERPEWLCPPDEHYLRKWNQREGRGWYPGFKVNIFWR